ncbi:olfactory receptor 1571-like [Gastrophryne carolinensis]
MAYDRYVAICIPLHYHSILNSRNCTILNIVIWILGGLNSAMFTAPATKMSFCLFNVIEQYFCEANALGKIACAGREDFQATAYFDLFLMGFCPFFGCLTSYTRIINVILSIHSKDGRIKAFSTCSSHIIVIFIYFGSGALDYLQSLSKSSHFQAQAITVLYANVTPMVNPIIYSLRNEELKQALKKLLGQLLRIFIK